MKKRLLTAGMALLMIVQIMAPLGTSAENAATLSQPVVSHTTDTLPSGADSSAMDGTAALQGVDKMSTPKASTLSYEKYKASFGDVAYGDGSEIAVSGLSTVLNEDRVTATGSFSVAKAGFYAVKWQYRSLGNSSSNHQIGVALDGAYPYSELALQEVPRIWLAGETRVLEDGTQVRDSSEADPAFYWYTAYDNTGLWQDPYLVYLTAGTHTLTLYREDGNLEVKNVTLVAYQGLEDYETYRAHYTEVYTGEALPLIEAESFVRTNSLSITAASDLGSPQTTPYSYQKQLLNVMGGSNWQYTGQRVEWTVTVPSAGLYHLSLRFKQSYKDNMKVYRKLTVNGEVPFKEAQSLAFDYKNAWQTLQPDWAIYLNAGENTLALEVTTGEAAELMISINDGVQRLNTLYRQILMITGSSPDSYRDYGLENEIPGIREELQALSEQMDEILKQAETIIGSTSAFSVVRDTGWQLRDMAEDLRSITKSGRLGRFKSNISSLASLGQKMREQPLQIDSITLSSPEHPAPAAKESFWAQAKHTWLRFIASFSDDYNVVIGSGKKDSVTVWTALGRDQLQILKSMVANEFTPKYNVNVQVQLVTGSLIQAVLAGKGPDMALGQGETDVINYAMRKALVNLKEMDGFDTVMKRFSANAASPFTYENGVYAIPQVQSFDMMFVRDDILEELGLETPRTWEDFTTKIFPVLQRDNLVVGVGNLNNGGALVSIFTTLLYQYGGSLYAKDLLSSGLKTPQALEAFDFAVSLYDEYGVPTEYDFLNRFRTGEMPIAIAPYATYNTLQVGAPEIAGQWTMRPIPGVKQADGTVNNTQLMSSNGVIMLAGTKSKTSCWKFIDWWTGAETQQRFGLQQEAVLGPSGRYTTANLEAMRNLSWSSKQLALLEEQRSVSTSLTHVPGSYYIGKSLNSALVTSVNDSTLIAREELMYWANLIDLEMARKQREFKYKGLSEAGEGETA